MSSFVCDKCSEYWQYDAVDCFTLADGRTVCAHCNKDLIADEEIAEDDLK